MRVTLLGTGYAIPTPERAQSGILVEIQEKKFLFDCGAGILQRIAESRRNTKDISAVFLTHYHLDHCSDFPAVLKANWLLQRTDMALFGPRGTGEWYSGLLVAYPYLSGRLDVKITELSPGEEVAFNAAAPAAPTAPAVPAVPTVPSAPASAAPAASDDTRDIKIKCAGGIHSLQNLGYKITSQEKSVVYSGDTNPARDILDMCRDGVDVLIHECAMPDGGRSSYNHSTPETLGPMLDDLPVKTLVLTHFSPDARGREEEMAEIVSKYFKGEIIIGYDLMEIEV